MPSAHAPRDAVDVVPYGPEPRKDEKHSLFSRRGDGDDSNFARLIA